MFVIIGKEGNKVRIVDTEDDAVEIFTLADIKNCVVNLGIKIVGATDKGVKVVHSDFEDVFSEFFHLMENRSRFSDKQSDIENGYAAVHHWGSWHMPEDIDEDEEEDYDWEELDSKWYPMLNQVKSALTHKFPDLKIEISTSEKNWVDLQLRRY